MRFIIKINLSIALGLFFLMVNFAWAQKNTPNETGTKKTTEKRINNKNLDKNPNIVSTVIPEKNMPNNNGNEYFTKIKDEIIPIETNTFSAKKTLLEYSQDPNYYPEIENINVCKNKKSLVNSIYCNLTTTLLINSNLKRKTVFEIDKKKLKEYLEALNKTIQESPSNVGLRADENGNIFVTKKEAYGYAIDVDEIVDNSLQYFNNLSTNKTLELPLKLISPTITSENYKKLGIKEKIGHGESNFRGSPKNRIHNIHNATGKFEGIVIPPNETFSFIKNLGAVDASTGYKEELVIKNHKTIPEFGGGVCQVSTTMFRTAINAGLKITERRNHAYPVSYYSPQGTDATVYIPKPDLQFINDTPGYILIQPYFNGTILSFDMFGTSDGRRVKTEGPTLLKRTPDGGKKYVYYQIIEDENGKQIAKNGFWSFYQNAASFHDHPTEVLTSKPKNWSSKEWKRYKREHGM
jgi:vancomycin resistance protein YoaR